MAYIEASVSRQQASTVAQQRQGRGFRKVFGKRQPPVDVPLRGDGSLPCIELIWFPHYLISITVTSRKGRGEITVLVEGYSGAFVIFEMHEVIVQGDPPKRTYPPTLTEEAATEIGRKRLVRAIMHQRSRGSKPMLEETATVSLLQYPYWVYYYERRPSLLDIRVVDGVMGSLVGTKTKVAILEAFAAA